MAFYIDWTEKLQATRAWLQDVKTSIDPSNYQKLTGLLNYLRSPLAGNSINAIQMQSADASVYRPVQIRYIPYEGTTNLVTTDSSANCNKTTQKRDIINTYEPTLFAEHKFTIELNYVRQNSENGFKLQQRLNKQILTSMRIVRESIDSQLFAKAATLVGANPAGATGAGSYKDIPLIINSSGDIDNTSFDVIKNEQEDNFHMSGGEVGIVGLGNARRYMNRLAVGNANSSGSVDYKEVAAQFGMLLFKDHFTTASLGGANRVLAFYPGSAQFYQYNLYKGDFAFQVHDGEIYGTLPDPVFPGITYDYKLKWDDNCSTGNGLQGAWVGRLFTYFDLWTVPEGAYGDVYSDLNDFNGIIGYNITES